MSGSVIADNRRARYDFDILETHEAGLVLLGTEVKAMREGRVTLGESYVAVEEQELWLINSHVPPCRGGNRINHPPRRRRKLLMKSREISKLAGASDRKGLALIAMRLYFDSNGRAKLTVGVGRGRKRYDKRELEKKRDWKLQQARLLRGKG